LLSAADFLGEECIATIQPRRISTATALTAATLLKITRKEIVRVLHDEHAFSDVFVAYLLARNLNIQEGLIDQLFNSSEKRLARALLLLARFGKEGAPETVIPKISQLLHEPFSQIGIYRIQRNTKGEQFSAERGSSRLKPDFIM
jgi:CRP-like cAMP-binding protein